MSEIKEMILKEVRARNYNGVKDALDKLEEQIEKSENLEKFADAIKSLLRNLGKSNMLMKSEVEALVQEYGI